MEFCGIQNFRLAFNDAEEGKDAGRRISRSCSCPCCPSCCRRRSTDPTYDEISVIAKNHLIIKGSTSDCSISAVAKRNFARLGQLFSKFQTLHKRSNTLFRTPFCNRPLICLEKFLIEKFIRNASVRRSGWVGSPRPAIAGSHEGPVRMRGSGEKGTDASSATSRVSQTPADPSRRRQTSA